EDGIRDFHVTGVQTCALPICIEASIWKGSTSHMLASILAAAGYKTGLYTSPHLVDFRERIRINGEMIPQKNVIDFVNEHRDLIRSEERRVGKKCRSWWSACHY